MKDIFDTSELPTIIYQLKRSIEDEDVEECLEDLNEELDRWIAIKEDVDDLITESADIISEHVFDRFIKIFVTGHFSYDRQSLKGTVQILKSIDFDNVKKSLMNEFEDITIEGTVYYVPIYPRHNYIKAIEMLKIYLAE